MILLDTYPVRPFPDVCRILIHLDIFDYTFTYDYGDVK